MNGAPYLINVAGTKFPEGAIGLDTHDVKVVKDRAFVTIKSGGYEQSGWVPLAYLHRDGQKAQGGDA